MPIIGKSADEVSKEDKQILAASFLNYEKKLDVLEQHMSQSKTKYIVSDLMSLADFVIFSQCAAGRIAS